MTRDARKYINEMLDDPSGFFDSGRAYELLQRYFDGYRIESLETLLSHPNRWVRRSAVWIASELGAAANNLLPSILSLLEDDDKYIRYHAIEVFTVCSYGPHAAEFAHVVNALQDKEVGVRLRAMRLIANADDERLEASIHRFKTPGPEHSLHEKGLEALRRSSHLTETTILGFLESKSHLHRLYGAIIVKREKDRLPELASQLEVCQDEDVQRFVQSACLPTSADFESSKS